MVQNAITIDVEDWYHVCGFEPQHDIPRADRRVRQATERILELLDGFGVKATFFVLGSVAAQEPGLVRQIAAGGHEVASHGWSHSMIDRLTPAQFNDELARTEEIIAAGSGCMPVGFRAPQWSLSQRTPWAHRILAERSYHYDSSLNPLPFIGDSSGSRTPFRITTEAGELGEFPPLVSPTWFGNMPTGGGWGFRFFPRMLIRHSIGMLNRAGHPAVIYLHPRDADPGGPQLPLPPLKRFAAYGTPNDVVPRLSALLKQFRFTTLKELAANELLHPDTIV